MKEPFWNTGEHPILGYYYNGKQIWNQAFHKSKKSNIKGFETVKQCLTVEINNALNKYR